MATKIIKLNNGLSGSSAITYVPVTTSEAIQHSWGDASKQQLKSYLGDLKASLDASIATVAKAPPKASAPVSPINTLAGCVLNNKKPKIQPTNTKQKIAIPSYPIIQLLPQDITPYARNAITHNPPHNPSRPSVILTALVVPTSKNKINTP